jgi:hypothetical protein
MKQLVGFTNENVTSSQGAKVLQQKLKCHKESLSLRSRETREKATSKKNEYISCQRNSSGINADHQNRSTKSDFVPDLHGRSAGGICVGPISLQMFLEGDRGAAVVSCTNNIVNVVVSLNVVG